jgi:hypothetical protein
MKNKLILLKRKRPNICEIHIGKIRQAHNILFTTTDEELAQNVVDSFNKFEGVKKKLAKTKDELDIKNLILEKVSKATKRKIVELNEKVRTLEKPSK